MIDWVGYRKWRPAFTEVMDLRLYTPEWLDGQIANGKALFWCTDKAAIVAETRRYPTGACDVHGLIAAGDLDDIRDVLIPAAEEWGRSIGCVGAIVESRTGWAKALKKQGYEPHQLALRKEFA